MWLYCINTFNISKSGFQTWYLWIGAFSLLQVIMQETLHVVAFSYSPLGGIPQFCFSWSVQFEEKVHTWVSLTVFLARVCSILFSSHDSTDNRWWKSITEVKFKPYQFWQAVVGDSHMISLVILHLSSLCFESVCVWLSLYKSYFFTYHSCCPWECIKILEKELF